VGVGARRAAEEERLAAGWVLLLGVRGGVIRSVLMPGNRKWSPAGGW